MQDPASSEISPRQPEKGPFSGPFLGFSMCYFLCSQRGALLQDQALISKGTACNETPACPFFIHAHTSTFFPPHRSSTLNDMSSTNTFCGCTNPIMQPSCAMRLLWCIYHPSVALQSVQRALDVWQTSSQRFPLQAVVSLLAPNSSDVCPLLRLGHTNHRDVARGLLTKPKNI